MFHPCLFVIVIVYGKQRSLTAVFHDLVSPVSFINVWPLLILSVPVSIPYVFTLFVCYGFAVRCWFLPSSAHTHTKRQSAYGLLTDGNSGVIVVNSVLHLCVREREVMISI